MNACKKMIQIEDCEQCPHYGTDKDVDIACKLKDIKDFGRKIPRDCHIPSWCPLPNKGDREGRGFPEVTCLRCGYTWRPYFARSPKHCSRCNSPYWNKETGECQHRALRRRNER